jgi:hypothetical protein
MQEGGVMRDFLSKIGGFGPDTAVVLFLLAVEAGRYGNLGSVESLSMAVAIVMLLVLPYVLQSPIRFGPSLAKWLVVRGLVASIGLGSGLVLPDSIRFLPMNFLILAGICSCFLQFYGLMKLRLAD